MAPFGDSSSREWAISLEATITAGGAVFPDDSFDVLLVTDAGAGDVSAPISYTLMAVPEPATAGLVLLGGLGMAVLRRIQRTGSVH